MSHDLYTPEDGRGYSEGLHAPTGAKLAVLTLTRNRLHYTKHCFATLQANAGCDYDHYVLDQGSNDGTPDWLRDEYEPTTLITLKENIGISRGMNRLLDLLDDECYDAVVKLDNDCELVQPDTLRAVAALAVEGNALLSPRILGLQNPPRPTGEFLIGDAPILDVPQIGGIFLAASAAIYDRFRYHEANPTWGGDDTELCRWHRAQGGRCGYVKRLEAWHYETTSGQHQRFPAYFAQKRLEGLPA